MPRFPTLLALLSASVAIASPLTASSTLVDGPDVTSLAIESQDVDPSATIEPFDNAFPSATGTVISGPLASPELGDIELTYASVGSIGTDPTWWDEPFDPDVLELDITSALSEPTYTLALGEPDATLDPTELSSSDPSALKKREDPAPTECPSVELELQTATSIEFVAVATTTDSETLTYTEYPATVTVISQSVATGYVYEYAATVTSTGRTTTRYAVSIEPAETTVTVPTPAGFTPVLCQAAYLNPTTTSVITSYTTAYEQPVATVMAEEPLVFYGVEYTSTELSTYSYDRTTTVRVYPTTTISSVRSDPTSTVYEACATNNVTPYAPDGGFLLAAISQPGTTETLVPAADATDCCALCQADEACATSAYTNAADTYCYHYLKDTSSNSTCEPSFIAARAVGSWNERAATYISNTGCGQYVLPKAGLVRKA